MGNTNFNYHLFVNLYVIEKYFISPIKSKVSNLRAINYLNFQFSKFFLKLE